MMNFFRSLGIRLGVITHNDIVAPLSKIVSELTAYVEHGRLAVAAIEAEHKALAELKSLKQSAINEAEVIRDKVAALFSAI